MTEIHKCFELASTGKIETPGLEELVALISTNLELKSVSAANIKKHLDKNK